MRTYVITSGVIFGGIVLAHVARMFAEGAGVASNPTFAGTSLLSLVLCVWAFRVLPRVSRG